MEIIFATGNRHKLEEAQQILGDKYTLKTPADFGITEDIPETADTIEGNALQKVQYIWDKVHMPCFADDTGLFVDALDGAPGVRSARYAGEERQRTMSKSCCRRWRDTLTEVPASDVLWH